MREFDAFAFLGLSASEEIHSNVLAWLLDPSENHSLGDLFLKGFLMEAGALSCQEISSTDWSATTVHREWRHLVDDQAGYLDILVVNNEVPFVCGIENKIFSGEHGNQLAHYRRALEQRYQRFRRSYLFLSPQGVPPQQEDDRRVWTPMEYGRVLSLVENAIDESAGTVNEAVAGFLQQYATCLRRTVVPSTEIRRRAARIYLQHREAIDLIISYKDAYVADLKKICREAITKIGGWDVVGELEGLLRLAPDEWRAFRAYGSGEGEKKAADVLIFRF